MICRIRYKKKDEIRYIGHLDSMRTFTRCIKRSDLPVTYSKGFNPRVQLTFALPLGVGVTSDCEYVDLQLDMKVPEEEVIRKLNSVLPIGFSVISASYVTGKDSLMSQVIEAKYKVDLYAKDVEYVYSNLDSILNNKDFIIEKQSKKNKRLVHKININDLIIDFKIEKLDDEISLYIHCFAGSEKNLNLNMLVEYINDKIDGIYDFDIHREELILREVTAVI